VNMSDRVLKFSPRRWIAVFTGLALRARAGHGATQWGGVWWPGSTFGVVVLCKLGIDMRTYVW